MQQVFKKGNSQMTGSVQDIPASSNHVPLNRKITLDLGVTAVNLWKCHREYSARIYRPSFRENKPKTLVLVIENARFWLVLGENWVFKFRHRGIH